MSDTVIFLMGCLVTALLLTGGLYSVREVRRLYELENPAPTGSRSNPVPDDAGD